MIFCNLCGCEYDEGKVGCGHDLLFQSYKSSDLDESIYYPANFFLVSADRKSGMIYGDDEMTSLQKRILGCER